MLEIITIITGGFERLLGGGWLLIPLVIYSLFAHAIILNRAVALRKKKLIPTTVISEIYRALTRGGPETAINLCNQWPGVLTNVMKAGIIHRHYDEERLKLVVKFALEDEKPNITRYLHILGMLPSVAMSTGLLGTVVGMIKSFGSLYVSPTVVAEGISEALITTVAGLTVALPTYIAHNYFSNRVSSILIEIERHSISLVRFLATGEYKLFQEEGTFDYSDLEAISKGKK
ncbi:TPA: MotA/TolQ/ExbB proton channel family protein [Candidatus Poribacteria bacterium]|nr:MotA/TolQ/ExbB proton channel family protein [Candidatus Poribacteria bacterium]